MIARSIASRSLKGTLVDLVLARLGEEELREAVVADLHREAGMAVIAALQMQMSFRRLVAWRALFSAMSIASPPPDANIA